MRQIMFLFFSMLLIVGLSGCVHHSVEYRASPQFLPYDRVVIKSSPYYKTTQIYKTIITPRVQYHQPKHVYHRIKKHHKNQFKNRP